MTDLKYAILKRLYALRPTEYLDRNALLSNAAPETLFEIDQVLRDLIDDNLAETSPQQPKTYKLRSSGRTAYEDESQRRAEVALAEHRRLESLQQHAQERAEDKAERKKDRRNELISVMIGSFFGAFFGVLLGLLADLFR